MIKRITVLLALLLSMTTVTSCASQGVTSVDEEKETATEPVADIPEDSTFKVDITMEGGSGKAIGYTIAGEWLEYSVNVKSAGKYKLTLNTASGSATSSLQFSVDGSDITDVISIPQTAENKWDVYQEVDAGEVELKAGEQIIRLTITGSYVNVDWFKFEAIGSNGEVIEIIDPPSSSSGATTTPGSSASKGSNDSKKEEAPAPEEPKGPTQEELLSEIRDLLKKK